MKKGLITGAAVVLILAVLGVGWVLLSRSETSGVDAVSKEPFAPGLSSTPVAVVTPQIQDLRETLTLHGKLRPASRVDVTPKGSGRITDVRVRIGDAVSAGDLLVQLETDELKLQVEQARAALEAAKANLQRLVEGPRPEEVEQAEAALAQAQANYENSKLVYERNKKLFEEGVLSAKDWDAIKAQFEVAKAQKLSAEKTLALIKKGARESEITAAKAQVKQAEVALKSAELQLSNTSITAPISGTVASVAAEVGNMASIGAPVVTIVDLRHLEIELQVGEREVVQLSPGQSVQVTTEALPGRIFAGVVDTVSPAADPMTGLFDVKVKVENAEQVLRPGMYATARVVVAFSPKAMAIPGKALLTGNGEPSVYVVEDGIAKLRPIKVGLSGDGMVEVLEGLSQEDLVVVSGQEFLNDGDSVKLVERGELQ